MIIQDIKQCTQTEFNELVSNDRDTDFSEEDKLSMSLMMSKAQLLFLVWRKAQLKEVP